MNNEYLFYMLVRFKAGVVVDFPATRKLMNERGFCVRRTKDPLKYCIYLTQKGCEMYKESDPAEMLYKMAFVLVENGVPKVTQLIESIRGKI
jgi:hypothetical protein